MLRNSLVDDFAQLAEETERLARHVEDLRHRIAVGARRRTTSSGFPAQDGRTACAEASADRSQERPRVTPLPERTSCLASVSRWLPPLTPAPVAAEPAVRSKIADAGRYSIVRPRCSPSEPPSAPRDDKAG